MGRSTCLCGTCSAGGSAEDAAQCGDGLGEEVGADRVVHGDCCRAVQGCGAIVGGRGGESLGEGGVELGEGDCGADGPGAPGLVDDVGGQ